MGRQIHKETEKHYMKKGKLTIIGVDPGSAKGIHYCSEEKEAKIGLGEIRKWITELKENNDRLLICWDSPLTGPPLNVVEGHNDLLKGHLTIRPIESFFGKKGEEWSPPKGISTLPYCGLSHWTISRFLFGLPRVGVYDATILPFQLLCEDAAKTEIGNSGKEACITEVHPALAAWVWCKNHRLPIPDNEICWKYKDKKIKTRKETMGELWDILMAEVFLESAPTWFLETPPKTADQFDARIAYMLGKFWMEPEGDVRILGGRDPGAFLLPNDEMIFQEFENSLT